MWRNIWIKKCSVPTKSKKYEIVCFNLDEYRKEKILKKDLVTAEIVVKENKVGILRGGNVNYISLTDLAKYRNSSNPSFTVKNWLRRINTIDYIGLWEEIHN